MSEYETWEAEITQQVEAMGMTRSDAEGLVMGQEFSMAQSWGLGLNASDAAMKVIAAATPSQTPRN